MKYSLLFILLLNAYYCQKEKILEIVNKIEQTNLKNIKNYKLTTLGYITPWNKEGYEYTLKYSNKFDIICPTWFELKPEEIDGELQIILDAGNNVDSTYMKNLKNKNPNILILPRLHPSFSELNIFKLWLGKEADQFIKVLERRIKYNNFDGYVLDCMSIWYNEDLLNKFINNFLPKVNSLMKKLNKKFIVTIIPKSLREVKSIVNKDIFKKVAKYVDYINIMTYDFAQYRGNNDKFYLGPISWIKDTIDFYVDKNDKERKKILFGLSFHGFAYNKKTSNPIGTLNSREFMKAMNENDYNFKVNYDEKEFEYYLSSDNDNIISYPLIGFLEKRLKISEELNIGGCGIWDIGNGKEGLLAPF